MDESARGTVEVECRLADSGHEGFGVRDRAERAMAGVALDDEAECVILCRGRGTEIVRSCEE